MQNLKSIKKPKEYKTLNSVYNINISIKKRKENNLTLDCYVVFNKERIDETIFKALASNPYGVGYLELGGAQSFLFFWGGGKSRIKRVAGHAAVIVSRVGTKR